MMNKWIANVLCGCAALVFAAGCGGKVKEQPAPDTTPEISEKDKKEMEKQNEMMKKYLPKGARMPKNP